MDKSVCTAWSFLVLTLTVASPALASPSISDRYTRAPRLPQTLNTDQIEVLHTLEYLREHLAISPDDLGLRGWRAWLYYLGMQYDSAIADLWFVLHEDPENWEARTFLGQVYLEKADVLYLKKADASQVMRFTELAVGEFKQALGKVPDDQVTAQFLARAYNDKAYYLYLRRQDLPLALELIDKAIALHEAETFYLSTKAEVLYALGRPKEALFHLKRALKDYPDEPELLQDLKLIEAALSTRTH